jgi:hypothetical protein
MHKRYRKIEHINSTATVVAVRIRQLLRRQVHFKAEKQKLSGNKVCPDIKFCKTFCQ